MSPRVAALLFGLSTIASGCSDSGYGRFEGEVVGGPDCLADVLPFESAFQTAQSRESSIRLFMQSDGGVPSGKDLFVFVNPDPDSVTNGSTFELTPPIGVGGSTFSGQFVAEESCPDETLSFYVTGSLVIDSFDDSDDAVIAGSLSNAEVREVGSDMVVMRNVSGAWEFSFEKGPPYEPYP